MPGLPASDTSLGSLAHLSKENTGVLTPLYFRSQRRKQWRAGRCRSDNQGCYQSCGEDATNPVPGEFVGRREIARFYCRLDSKSPRKSRVVWWVFVDTEYPSGARHFVVQHQIAFRRDFEDPLDVGVHDKSVAIWKSVGPTHEGCLPASERLLHILPWDCASVGFPRLIIVGSVGPGDTLLSHMPGKPRIRKGGFGNQRSI